MNNQMELDDPRRLNITLENAKKRIYNGNYNARDDRIKNQYQL